VVTGHEASVEDIQIYVVQDWPGGTDPKVPSKFTFSKQQSGFGSHTWGFQIGKGSHEIRYTKLKLPEPNRLEALRTLKSYLDDAPDQSFESEVPVHLVKTPADTLNEYLTKIAEVVRKDIEDKRPAEALKRAAIELIISHPAVRGQLGPRTIQIHC